MAIGPREVACHVAAAEAHGFAKPADAASMANSG
jgi:hypothetical protein